MQTSAKQLSLQKQTLLLKQFFVILADLQHPQDVSRFFTNFFTETELSVFTKRLAILLALAEGKSYEEIKDELHVSSATISSMAGFANAPTIKRVQQILMKDAQASAFLDAILGKKQP